MSLDLDNMEMVATAGREIVAVLTKTNEQLVGMNEALNNQLKNLMENTNQLAEKEGSGGDGGGVDGGGGGKKNSRPWTSSIPRNIVGVVGERCILATRAKPVGVNRQTTRMRQ